MDRPKYLDRTHRLIIAIVGFTGVFALLIVITGPVSTSKVTAQSAPSTTPTPFDRATAIASLRERIKGKEQEPAENVFKNIQSLKGVPAGRLLAIMQMGYARSLGVDCTHCHNTDKWEAEDKPQKQIAREMSAMAARINSELLKNIKNLRSEMPVVNCTTCHRGQIKPATDLPGA